MKADRKLQEAGQELGYLEGCRPHVPRDQMWGTAEEVGHRVVRGRALGACRVVGPA